MTLAQDSRREHPRESQALLTATVPLPSTATVPSAATYDEGSSSPSVRKSVFAKRAEEEPDVEHDAPFDETWPPDESQRPLDDEEVLELEASRRDEPPAADDLVDRRYTEAWLALTRLHASGSLPKDALDRLVEMQNGARKAAGGRTTSDMLEQLERWLKSYEHEATGSPLEREVEL